MQCIIGLGNPGEAYQNTRHNTGYGLVGSLAHAVNAQFSFKSKFKANIAEMEHADQKVLLVKPTTFYNMSGESVRSIIDFYKIDLNDILVIHDELALPFGTIRARFGGSDAGNNGIKSLNQHLGVDYARLRVGIANDLLPRIGAHDFVLARFSQEETAALHAKLFEITQQYVEEFLDGRLESHTTVAATP